MTYPIKLKNRMDVVRVSEVAANAGVNMTIHCGSIEVDPRSVLALFMLLGKTVNLVAPDSLDPNDFSKIIKKMGVSA